MEFSRDKAEALLSEYVSDPYQQLHAHMLAVALEGYANLFEEDPDLWYITGLLHDLDFEQYPDRHPAPSLGWFAEWQYPSEFIHAVESHAYGYNGFEILPQTRLAACLMACDEISGIFYAYQKLNPIPYGDMKVSSIKKRLREKSFAPKIERDTIYRGIELPNVSLEDHIQNLIAFFGRQFD